jgi:Ribosomal protein S3, C-terminal domain
MGQKTNPNILRLSQTDNWKSSYREKKSNELYLYTVKDLEVRKLITFFFKTNGLIIKNVKINYLNNHLNMLIDYHQSSKSVLLIRTLSNQQKVRLMKKQNYILKNKIKQYNLISKSVKKFFNYENLVFKSNMIKQQNLPKLNKKAKRIQILNYYKRFLSLKTHKTLGNLNSNKFLEPLFLSLKQFYPELLKLNLILKPLNNNIFKRTSFYQRTILKKKLIKFKKYNRNEFFKEGVNLIFALISHKSSANLLANYIATTLQKLKRHNFFLRFLKTILIAFCSKSFLTVIKGIKIKIKGRLNGASRARYKKISVGKYMPVLSINSQIDYAESTSFTSNGTIGIKVWVCD